MSFLLALAGFFLAAIVVSVIILIVLFMMDWIERRGNMKK
jgi:uncharacterized membrane protein YhiD involved in acid resistance